MKNFNKLFHLLHNDGLQSINLSHNEKQIVISNRTHKIVSFIGSKTFTFILKTIIVICSLSLIIIYLPSFFDNSNTSNSINSISKPIKESPKSNPKPSTSENKKSLLPQKIIAQNPTTSHSNTINKSLSTPQNNIIKKDLTLSVGGMIFSNKNNLLISPPFPFTKFNSIESINDYIAYLNNSSNNNYHFSVPTDSIVRKNLNLFSSLYEKDLFYICLYDNRLGYFYFLDGQPVFSNLSTVSLKTFADKFIIYIISTQEN